MSFRDIFTYVAKQIYFDKGTSGMVSENVEDAIKENRNTLQTSASPGYSFGRASNANNNTWLQVETVPSNKAGRYVYINSATITEVFVSVETVSTFDVSIYEHEGDEVNLTFIGTVSIAATRGGAFPVNWAITTGRQLAMRITSGSTRNIVAGLELSGSI